MSVERHRVADFWDQAIADWIEERAEHDPKLARWRSTYEGSGKGELVLSQYADPFAGDLRGETEEPRIVTLGINPGVGYDELQGRKGLWTSAIASSSYSRVLHRNPSIDVDNWLRLHGKKSPYWNKLVWFGRRWLDSPDLGADAFLNFELYPWHSLAFKGRFRPDADLTNEFVFKPIGEVDVPIVFAFGAGWFNIADQLRLPLVRRYTDEELQTHRRGHTNWRVALHDLGNGQSLLISSQSGSGSPPGAERLKLLRILLADSGHTLMSN
jgi:hypothetical protein